MQEIVDFYSDNQDSVEAGAGIGVVAAILLVFFSAHLRKVLRAAEGEGGTLSLVAFAGGVIVAISGAIDSTISIAMTQGVEDNVDPGAILSLQTLWDNDWLPFILGVLLLDLGAGLSIVRHGALPAWLGWVAIALGVVGMVGVVIMNEIGFIAVIGTAIWILVVSILLTVRARGSSAPVTA